MVKLKRSPQKNMKNSIAVLQFLVLSVLQVVCALTQCSKSALFLKSYIRHHEDCSLYYVCFHGRRFLKKCDDEKVFDLVSASCVPRGSPSDSCSSATETDYPVCLSSGDLYSHAQSCAKYYDCSNTSRGGVPQSRECLYPYLFDSVTRTCQYFTEVNCESRPEPKYLCNYDVYPCTGTDCLPCRSRFPSCVDHPDGLNPWAGREWTSHYIVCSMERTIFQGICTNGWVFHPTEMKCVTADKITLSRQNKS